MLWDESLEEECQKNRKDDDEMRKVFSSLSLISSSRSRRSYHSGLLLCASHTAQGTRGYGCYHSTKSSGNQEPFSHKGWNQLPSPRQSEKCDRSRKRYPAPYIPPIPFPDKPHLPPIPFLDQLTFRRSLSQINPTFRRSLSLISSSLPSAAP